MQAVDSLILCESLITCDPARRVLGGGALAIDGGEIAAIGEARDIAGRYRAARVFDLGHHAVLPGLINAHTHAAMSLLRGYADDLALMDWLTNHIWPAETRLVSGEFVRAGTELAIAEMLLGGTTCFNDMYFFPEAVAQAAETMGIRAVVGLILLDFPTAYADGPDTYLRKAGEVHDDLRHSPLVTTAFAPHAPYTVSDEPLVRMRTLADELDLPIHMHVHETADEVARSIEQHGMRPLERLNRLGLVNDQLLAVHLTQLKQSEISLLAGSGSHVLHCPESNAKLASGRCPLGALLGAGVNVALGTDGAASNNDLDMFGEMRSAAFMAKLEAADATCAPATAVLDMATINGARALKLDHLAGSLEPGKRADIIAVDLDRPATRPDYESVSTLVYSASRDQVSHVWVDGRLKVENGRLVDDDLGAILATGRDWSERAARIHAVEPS